VTSLGPGAFVPENPADLLSNSFVHGVYFQVPTSWSMLAPVDLPHGATVTSLTLNVRDTSATVDATAVLGRKEATTFGSVLTAATATPTGSSGFMSATGPSSHVVDNASGSYFVVIHPGTSWPGNTTLAIQTVVIEWTMP
jgi:hypothetical protein